MSDNYDGPQMAQKILRQQAEIERLRDQVTRLSTLVDTERSLHDAEIEQLRSELLAEAIRGQKSDTENEKLRNSTEEKDKKIKILVATLDDLQGTPCEQIRHAQEIERLRRVCQELYFDLEGDTQHFERWLEAQK